ELRELEQVEGAEFESAAGEGEVERRVDPLDGSDGERPKEILLRVLVGGRVREVFEGGSEGGDAGGAIREAAAEGLRLRLFAATESADGQVEVELDPVLDGIHALFVAAGEVVPVVALGDRGHGEQVFEGDGVLAR